MSPRKLARILQAKRPVLMVCPKCGLVDQAVWSLVQVHRDSGFPICTPCWRKNMSRSTLVEMKGEGEP